MNGGSADHEAVYVECRSLNLRCATYRSAQVLKILNQEWFANSDLELKESTREAIKYIGTQTSKF